VSKHTCEGCRFLGTTWCPAREDNPEARQCKPMEINTDLLEACEAIAKVRTAKSSAEVDRVMVKVHSAIAKARGE
jgi:hypothetical protein